MSPSTTFGARSAIPGLFSACSLQCRSELFCCVTPNNNGCVRIAHSQHDLHSLEHKYFSRTPGVDDWARFTPYARRVRSLSLNERDRSTLISKDVFDEISRSRVSLNILPSLRTLIWLTESVDRMRLSLLFQHESITAFTVYLHKTSSQSLSMFFKEVLLRMPNLTHLDLRFDFPASEVEAELIELFSGLLKLRRVIMPAYTFTSRIMETLSRQRDLGTIQFEFLDLQGHGEMEDVVSWSPQLHEGAFPSLWDLSLSANLPDLTSFLTANFAPTNLTSLYVHVLSAPSLEHVGTFLRAVSENCQALTHLYMDFFTSSVIPPTPSTWPRLSWETLRPLLSCPNLVSFELRWDHPLELTQVDIEEIASSWPELEVLLLNCEPMDNSVPPTLGLEALLPFARHCTKLRELGLYLSALSDVPEAPRLSDRVKPFHCLRRLTVGLSCIEDAGQVALFLSQLCPLDCEILSGVTWPEDFAVVETEENMDALTSLATTAAEWFHKWAEVQKMLPLLTKLRMQERQARETLEKEAEDLRIRCKLMEERMNMNVDPDGSCTPF